MTVRPSPDGQTRTDPIGDWAEQTLSDLAKAPDGPIPLLDGGLALACFDAPVASLDPYRAHLDQMVTAVAETAGAEVAGAAPDTAPDTATQRAALAHVFFTLYGYRGDAEDYDDLQNANLIRVIDRRKGLPVALGILIIHLARAQGWTICGLDFPGHFLLRLGEGTDLRILDPFHGAAEMDAAALRAMLKATLGSDAELTQAHYEPVPDRQILLRLQNNIKIRLIRDNRIEEAAGIVDSMLRLAPDHASLWRESGLMHAHIGNIRTAIRALGTYLDHESQDPSRREAEALLTRLKMKLT